MENTADEFRIMYDQAFSGLMNGRLMPCDRELLSGAPLPYSVIEPYIAKEVPDVRESMRLTYETMVVWIDEAKKVSYFSTRFLQLSKMIMNGVTTMGRGLITLHARGEELTDVPMSIRDLIGVASYHFRKSHLGCLQTVRSHPEISERLLMNQIGWNNMLMRLFKTREKLAETLKIAAPQSPGLINSECGMQNAELSRLEAPFSNAEGGERFAAPLSSVDRGITEPGAVREPGALTAPRAFSSFDGEIAGVKRSDAPRLTESKTNGQNEVSRAKSNQQEPDRAARNGEEEKVREISSDEPESTEDKHDVQPEVTGTDVSQRITPADRDSSEERIIEICSDYPDLTEDKQQEQPEDTLSEADRPDSLPPIPNLPLYLQIIKNVYSRSRPSDKGGLTFTYEEMCYLTSDPDFNKFYPRTAASLHAMMEKANNRGP